jgi:hypothetical protein
VYHDDDDYDNDYYEDNDDDDNDNNGDYSDVDETTTSSLKSNTAPLVLDAVFFLCLPVLNAFVDGLLLFILLSCKYPSLMLILLVGWLRS